MKVFISWSGEKSLKVAQALHEWLPNVIQRVKPFFSPEDITSGKRWNLELDRELQESNVGIICLTRDNKDAPWILFEAGALSKIIEQSLVIPLLIDLRTYDVQQPLSQFNAASFDRDGIYKLLCAINKGAHDNALTDQQLNNAFDQWFPKLDAILDVIRAESYITTTTTEAPSEPISDETRSVLELILTEVRTLSNSINDTRSIQLQQETINRLSNLQLRECLNFGSFSALKVAANKLNGIIEKNKNSLISNPSIELAVSELIRALMGFEMEVESYSRLGTKGYILTVQPDSYRYVTNANKGDDGVDYKNE